MGDVTVHGNALVLGSATADKGLDTANDAVVRQNLVVLGQSQLGPTVVAGKLTATGCAVATAAEIQSHASVGGDLAVTGGASLRGHLTHTGEAPTVSNVSLKQADGSPLPGGAATLTGTDAGGSLSLYTFDNGAPYEMGSGSTVSVQFASPLAVGQTAVVTACPGGGKWKNLRLNAVALPTGFSLQAIEGTGTATLGGPGGDVLQVNYTVVVCG